MSRAMMEALKTPGLTPTERTLYAYLVGRANGAHLTWPSGEEIARDLGINTRQSRATASAKLVRLGLIEVKRRFHDTNHFIILDPDGRLYAGEPAKPHISPNVRKTAHLEQMSEKPHILNVRKTAQGNVRKTAQESFLQERVQEESSLRSDSPRARNRRAQSEIEGWDEFWEMYPRKAGKTEAFREYQKALTLVDDYNDIIDALVDAIDDDDGQFAKHDPAKGDFRQHPRTWLHNGPWKLPGWKSSQQLLREAFKRQETANAD